VLSGSPYNPHAYEPYSLRDDAGLRRRMTAAMREPGMETTVEFAPSLTVGDLDAVLAAVRHVGRPGLRLLIDTMQLVRAGHTASDLAAIDPTLIGYVQLSDNTVRFSSRRSGRQARPEAEVVLLTEVPGRPGAGRRSLVARR
jgi:sugar phosphate isomerase/epimerase